MSILDAIRSGKQQAEEFIDEKARYYLGPHGYNVASGIMRLVPELSDVADVRDYFTYGGQLGEKLKEGQLDSSTFQDAVDTTGSGLAMLIPGLSYRTLQEGTRAFSPSGKASGGEDFNDRMYHFSLGDVDQSSIKKFSMEVLEEKRALRDADPDLKDTFIRGNENIDLLGLHVGPLKEAQSRQSALSRDFRTRLNIAKNEFPEKIVEVDLGDGDVVTKIKGDPYDDLDGLTGSTYYPLQVNLSKPFTNPNSADGVWEDFELAAEIQKRKNQDLISNVEKKEGLDRAIEVDREQIKKVRRELAEEGYTNIPYVYGNQFAPRKNRTANSEEINQIMLIDQPKNKTVIKSAITGEPMAEGGLVSLTTVARDMFRGPQGISAFEQFIAKPQRPMVS